MPCHAEIDYEADDWRDQIEWGARCAGSLVFMRNSCQIPRKRSLRESVKAVTADHKAVFSNRQQFLEHHARSQGTAKGKKSNR